MNQDTLEKFGQSFQRKILTALITDSKLLDNLSDIINPDFFESEVNRWIAEEIISHHKEYKTLPTADVFKSQLEKVDDKAFKTRIVEQLKEVFTQIGETDLDYVKDEFSNFCKNQKIKDAINKSVDLLKAGDYNQIKTVIDDAMRAGVNLDLGHDYLEEFDKRTEEISRNVVSTGWNCIDDIMAGGLGPGELGVVVGGAGSGKCVGEKTEIEIQYEEIGFELANGYILWFAPWDKIHMNDNEFYYAWQAEKIISLAGYGKTL